MEGAGVQELKGTCVTFYSIERGTSNLKKLMCYTHILIENIESLRESMQDDIEYKKRCFRYSK